MHKHLARQLRRLGIDESTPPSSEQWRELLYWIGSTYGNMDRERYLIEHSLEVSSHEMQELNQRLVDERDKFASIFRTAPNGMTITSIDGTIVEVNETITKMLGYSAAEVIGRNVGDFVDPVDLTAVRTRLRDVAEGRVTVSRSHRRLLSRAGEPILADVQSQILPQSEGHVKRLLILVDDVTEKTRLEIELRHSQKLESVGRLAAGIAHEINTPIQFVGDNVSFLAGAFEQVLALCETYRALCEKAASGPLSAADLAQRAKDEEAADLDYIRKNVPTSIASTIDGVGRVARIVQSMKAFAHPDRGERTVADVNAALRNTLTVATNELKYVARVETEYGDIPSVSCFLSDLNQVFLNLLVNAAHAIGDVVGTTGERGVIRLRTWEERKEDKKEDKKHVVVAISDTGTGIPPAIRGKIFDPFFTTKGVGKGTGQGLALAHSVVVEQHGGTITFDTEVGKGTTFYVRIPVEPPENESAPDAVANDAARRRRDGQH